MNTLFTGGARIPIHINFTPEARSSNVFIKQEDNDYFTVGQTHTASQWIILPQASSIEFDIHVSDSIAASHTIQLTENKQPQETITIYKPIRNQSIEENNGLDIHYDISQQSSETFHYASICLTDFNGQLIHEVLTTDPQGHVHLSLPEISSQTNMFVKIRAFFGDTYRFVESQTGIRVLPDLKKPHIKWKQSFYRMMVGSMLDCSIDIDTQEEITSFIQVYDQDNHLLQTNEKSLSLGVTETTKTLSVLAWVSDASGNTDSIQQSIDVIHPFDFKISDDTQTFDVCLPDVGNSWFARGNILIDSKNNTRFQLTADILSMAHIGNDLLLITGEPALIRLSTQPIQRKDYLKLPEFFHKIIVLNERVYMMNDTMLYEYQSNTRKIIPVDLPTNIGSLLTILPGNDRLILLSTKGLWMLDLEHQLVYSKSGDFSAMAVTANDLYVIDSHSLLVIDRETQSVSQIETNISAERLMVWKNFLFALSGQSQTLWVFDCQNPKQPQFIGKFPQLSTGNVSNAIIANGRLYMGDDAGTIIQIVPYEHLPLVKYQSSHAQGYIEHIQVSGGQGIAAAGAYGAMIFSLIDGHWTETVYPSPFGANIHAVASHRNNLYLLQPDFNQLISLNENYQSSVLYGGEVSNLLILHSDFLVTSQDENLIFIHPKTLENFSIGCNDTIIAMASTGQYIFASTLSNGIIRLGPITTPIHPSEIPQKTVSIHQKPVRLMQGQSDKLFYAIDQTLYILEHNVQSLDFDDSIDCLGTDKGSLLIGVGENIYLLETEKELPQVPRHLLTANYPVTALDMDNQTIIAGLGIHGIAVFEISLLSVNASSSMDFSRQSMIFSSTDDLPLKLNTPEGINSVNYLLDDTVIAKTTTPPFSFNAPVPATLHNGQTFQIQAIIETHSGEIFTSKAYTANVYTQSLPENTIEISLIINNDYLPLPVNIHSAVTSTIYPISHIE
ncbi:IPT/TIG domain-containing protein, partial [Candidatus Magnetomorum sp. HK-1]